MSNCLFVALGHLWREGGHLVWRRSRYRWWLFHVIWGAPDLRTFRDYVPARPGRDFPLFFRGRHRTWSAPEPRY